MKKPPGQNVGVEDAAWDEAPQSADEVFARTANTLARKVDQTHNPIYLWKLISVALDPKCPIGLPDDCLVYLRAVALNLVALSEDNSLSPEQATKKLAQAMFFTRPGWGAVGDYRRQTKAEKISLANDFLKAQGIGRAARIAMIRENFRMRTSDPAENRAVLRLIKEGRSGRRISARGIKPMPKR